MNAQDVKISPEWQQSLSVEFESPYFDQIRTYLKQSLAQGKIIYPPGKYIFNAYDTVPPSKVKVVILGQDPYHNPGEAMGLSFSVPKGVKIPPSLRNIYKELQSDIGCEIPSHGDLTKWAHQGVFLLNAFLTVEKNQAASHRNIGWHHFTDATIQYLSSNYDHIVFMLWGNFAKNKRHLIHSERHLILEAAHPSPLAGNAFQGCRHFSQANHYLIEHSKAPIDWQID
ncbi:MAG: uracil-DNA glycosylase [Saprospiraceae bacterium]|nr:MAG: uracil-DNA glycosylase [Bacteroidetes bacterium OLB9]MCO6463263.1 uracil-DNA glycosylase [Saprospiraceae bacterium]MCZ2337293.1 uracil-DNA glycosylase [Chitinophagales bacterium]